jgi:hypothetical protein
MNRGILHSALRNPGLHLELEYREPANAGSQIHSSWKLADNKHLDLSNAAWFEFCNTILGVGAAETL